MPTTERLRAALAERYAIEQEIGSDGLATVGSVGLADFGVALT